MNKQLTRWLVVVAMAAALRCEATQIQLPVCKNGFTEPDEQKQGEQVAAKVYDAMPVLKDSDPVAVYVRQLGEKLVNYAPGYAWRYNFHVVASDEINAFALPGGSVFVNLATVQAAESEAQLAGVMGHELSHVVMRHATCNITKQQTRSIWYGLGQIAAQATIGGRLGDIAAQGIGTAAGLDFLRMGRDAEKQADLMGTHILYDAGYDPRGMPQFFEIIQAKYGEGGAQFLSDHPNPGNRTQYVSAEIASLPPRDKQVRTTDAFRRMHDIAMKEKALKAEEVKAGAWKKSGEYEKAPKMD
ncbi:M48 family metalloprotease [Terriglobus albidus]|uniref:M48 family metalloprotease n=1 Tax=Terriglobus albidus TaxID=1592106 RepID=A0A5B9EKE3_9BACT|nr:M48 family metalloprotease [Terriglobus albidus]QEE30821.1 M48 family metalloprotease [Terriglobus albidus]